MNIIIVGPIILFIVTSYAMYTLSKDPDKKEKPIKFIFPGIIVSLVSYLALKYKDTMGSEPMMQGSYFE